MYDYDIDPQNLSSDNRAADRKALDNINDKQRKVQNVQNLATNARQIDKQFLGGKYSNLAKNAFDKSSVGKGFNQALNHPSYEGARDLYHNLKDWNIFRPWGQGAKNAREAREAANNAEQPASGETPTETPSETPETAPEAPTANAETNPEVPAEPTVEAAPQPTVETPVEPITNPATDTGAAADTASADAGVAADTGVADATAAGAEGAVDTAAATGGATDAAVGAGTGGAVDTAVGASAGAADVAVGTAATGEAVAGGTAAAAAGAGGAATAGAGAAATGGGILGAIIGAIPTGGLGAIPGYIAGAAAVGGTAAAVGGAANKFAEDSRADSAPTPEKTKEQQARQEAAQEIQKAEKQEDGEGKFAWLIVIPLFASPLLLGIILLFIAASGAFGSDTSDSTNKAAISTINSSLASGDLILDSLESKDSILNGDVSDKTLRTVEYLLSRHRPIKIYYVNSLQDGKTNEPFEFDIGEIDKIKCTNTTNSTRAFELPIDLKLKADWVAASAGKDPNLLCAVGYYPILDAQIKGKYADLLGPGEFKLSDIARFGPVAAQEKTAEVIDEIISLNELKGIENDDTKSLLPNSLTINSIFSNTNLMDSTRVSLKQALSVSLSKAYTDEDFGVGLQSNSDEKGIHVSFF